MAFPRRRVKRPKPIRPEQTAIFLHVEKPAFPGFPKSAAAIDTKTSKSQLTAGVAAFTRLLVAQMAELVDAQVSGTCAARRGGSSPLLGTSFMFRIVPENPKTPRKRGFLLPFCGFSSLRVQERPVASKQIDGIFDGILLGCHQLANRMQNYAFKRRTHSSVETIDQAHQARGLPAA